MNTVVILTCATQANRRSDSAVIRSRTLPSAEVNLHTVNRTPSTTASSGSTFSLSTMQPRSGDDPLNFDSVKKESPLGPLSSKQTSPKTLSESPNQAPIKKPTQKMTFDTALGAGKGVSRIVGAGLKSPMDFTLSLAKGFHNAPKLYGDETVRQTEKITGLQSGLKVAGKVFVPEGVRRGGG